MMFLSWVMVCHFYFLLLAFNCYLYTKCLHCAPFLSALDIFSKFIYQEKRREKGLENSFSSFSRQFQKNTIEEPLKGCNALINLSRTPLYLIIRVGSGVSHSRWSSSSIVLERFYQVVEL